VLQGKTDKDSTDSKSDESPPADVENNMTIEE